MQDYGDSFGLGASLYEEHLLLLAHLAFLDQSSRPQVLGGYSHDISHQPGSGSQSQHLQILPAHPANSQHSLPGQIVLSGDSDSLLAEDHIGPGGGDGIDLRFDHILLSLFEAGEVLGLGYGDLGIGIKLLDLQGSLEKHDFSILDLLRHLQRGSLLLQYNAVDYGGVVDPSAGDHHRLDVLLYVLALESGYGLGCFHRQGSQLIHGHLNALSQHSGPCDLGQSGLISRDIHSHLG